jgi:gluconolactonase
MRLSGLIPVVLLGTVAMATTMACNPRSPATEELRPRAAAGTETVGTLDVAHPSFSDLAPPYASIDVLAKGFTWAEGPVWIPDGEYLLFSDVPENTVYRWDSGGGLSEWLSPSGDTGYTTGGRDGANGLLLDANGRLVLCQHGDRRVARLGAPLDRPEPRFETVAAHYGTDRFNSPNDAVYHSSGDLYFTDPPYGLADPDSADLKYQGVYRLKPDGVVQLLTSELSRPNGIAFSPDETLLYVANSDPERALWMVYDVEVDGSISNGRVFFDAPALVPSLPGLPDGLKVDVNGNVFATGPGGVLVFSADAQHLGTIRLPMPAANCAFGDDGRSLYITADSHLLRVRLTTRGRIGLPGRATPRPG